MQVFCSFLSHALCFETFVFISTHRKCGVRYLLFRYYLKVVSLFLLLSACFFFEVPVACMVF